MSLGFGAGEEEQGVEKVQLNSPWATASVGTWIRESLCTGSGGEKCLADQRDQEEAWGGPWIPFPLAFPWREMAMTCRDCPKDGQKHVMS